MTEKQINDRLRFWGKTIKKERIKRDLTITQAAALIGTSHQNLNNIEAGEGGNIRNILKVLSYYGLTIELNKLKGV